MSKIIILIMVVVLFILHVSLIAFESDIYFDKEYTGEKECKICIKSGEQYPCECEEKIEYNRRPETWILPMVILVLALLNFAIPSEK